jgi:hypothetical protein
MKHMDAKAQTHHTIVPKKMREEGVVAAVLFDVYMTMPVQKCLILPTQINI